MSTTIEINPVTDGLPTEVGCEGVARYAAALGVAVTPRFVKQQVLDGKLTAHVVARRHTFSRRNVRAWLESLTRTEE